MSQLSFDLACNGAALAANHADRVSPGWSERALAAFRAYAATHEEFTTEDVIEASPNVPAAVEKRAWGQIALAAKRQKIIRNAGYAHSKLAHAHCRPVTRWVSLICSLDFVHLAAPIETSTDPSLKAEKGWISVEKDMPHDSGFRQIKLIDGTIKRGRILSKFGDWSWFDEHGDTISEDGVTHWRDE